MGQYWYCVNLDKKEFIHPHALGAGLKLWEQLANHPSTGTALIILCAAMPGPRGGGDLQANPDVVGRWAGDRIAFVGDYAEDGDIPSHDDKADPASTIYARCGAKSPNGALENYEEPYRSQLRPKILGKPIYHDITPMVAKVIEDELEGKFSGAGWKDFVREGGQS
jgi:hypothetical protein